MPGRNDQTALTHAVLVQNSRIFNYLLTLPGLDLDAVTDDGRTALMLAVQTSRDARRVVSQLIAAGADPLVISLEGKTARRYSQDSIVSKLLQDAENI
jgi:ankyrin repeat protein